MKLLFIAPRYHMNMHYRFKALSDVGHKVSIMTFFSSDAENHNALKPKVFGCAWLSNTLKKLFLPLTSKNKRNTYSQQLNFFPWGAIRKEISSNKYDAVVIKGFSGLFVLQSLFWTLIFRKKAYLLLQTNKHYAETPKKKVQQLILKYFFRVSGIISPLKNDLNKHDSFYTYIPFVIETGEFDKVYFKNNKINIVTLGKIVKRKDHLSLLKVVNKLKNEFDISLTIIGEKVDDEEYQNIMKFINEHNLKDVNVRTDIPNKKVYRIFRESDLFVLPSYNEPAAYSLLEAMACKLPVICSDSNGTKCYIKESQNGYIFRSSNIDDLAEKIRMIIRDKDILADMGEESFRIAQNSHSPENFVKEFNKLF